MKRKIYFARRIASNKDTRTLLDVAPHMSPEEILSSYAEKEIDCTSYVHNGHWILRPAHIDGSLEISRIPKDLTTSHIRTAVLNKINTSDAFIAFLTPEAFGAIAELGYAAGTGKIAVYVLPEPQVTRKELLELWLSFQIAYSTRPLWNQSDIDAIPEFNEFGIHTIEEYSAYIESLIPKFLLL